MFIFIISKISKLLFEKPMGHNALIIDHCNDLCRYSANTWYYFMWFITM